MNVNEIPVEISIPQDLIDKAKCYPTIDWNEVMRYAVDNFDQHRAAQPEVRGIDVIAEGEHRFSTDHLEESDS